MSELRNLFVDPDESEIAILGGNYIGNFLSGGGLSNGFCVVSNKRAYFKGKCYYKDGNGHLKADKEERVVDLDNITGSGFIHGNITPMIVKVIFLTVTIISFLLEVMCIATGGTEDAFVTMTFIFLATIAVSIGSWLIKSKLFEINYAGGGIAFLASDYSEKEMQDFQVALRRAKDSFVTARNTQTVYHQMPSQVAVQPSDSKSVASTIKEYKELLDSGAITQEEYEKAKQKLLG